MRRSPIAPMSAKRTRELESGVRRNAPGSTLRARTAPIGAKKSAAQSSRDEERREREFARKYGSIERVFFVSAILCCAVPDCTYDGDNENAHLVTGGMGYKADATKVGPLCPDDHSDFHDGVQTFVEETGIDLERVVIETDEAWQLYGEEAVARAKADGRFGEWLERTERRWARRRL